MEWWMWRAKDSISSVCSLMMSGCGRVKSGVNLGML